MHLSLEQLSKSVAGQAYLYPLDLALKPGQVTVLLGATQSGKTTLMRLMAGLDRPSEGRIRVDGRDVTGVSVRERNVAMVYQQFINYPSMTVYDNIASPLRLAKHANIDARVRALAKQLHIDPFLDRLPAALSGGQQQRVALARALAKNAPLMLFDEPLVNLDYKLREELREDLTQLFASGDATVVYATTEPAEALLLGGYTAVLDQGELLQYGPTAEVFHRPASIRVARAFSDPPINLLSARVSDEGLCLSNGMHLKLTLPEGSPTDVVVGLRAHAVRQTPDPDSLCLPGTVELAEISGSDTFVHAHTALGDVVAQLAGVHQFTLGQALNLFIDPARVLVFDAAGPLLLAPAHAMETH